MGGFIEKEETEVVSTTELQGWSSLEKKLQLQGQGLNLLNPEFFHASFQTASVRGPFIYFHTLSRSIHIFTFIKVSKSQVKAILKLPVPDGPQHFPSSPQSFIPLC